jgi:hypothetical protein
MLGRALGAACAAAFVITGCGPDPDIVQASGELEAALAESERLGLPLTAAQLSGKAPPDSENAAAGLLEPLAKWEADRKQARLRLDLNEHRTPEAAALDDPILDLAAPNLERPRWHVDRDYVLGMNIVMPEYSYLRNLSKAFVWRASQRLEQGDSPGAIRDIASAQRLARHMRQDPTLIGALVCMAMDGIAGQAALDSAESWKSSPEVLRRLAQTIQDNSFDVDLLASLRGEVYFGANTSRNLHHYGGVEGLNAFTGTSEDIAPKVDLTALNDTEIPQNVAQRAYFARTMQFWNKIFSDDDLSISAVMERIQTEQRRVDESSRPSEKLLRVLLPVFNQAGLAAARHQLMQDMRPAVVLAAAFRAEQGRWPKDLGELGLQISHPYTGKPVGYAAQGDRITLWAPEPGTEDQGAVFEAKPGEKPDTWRIIWPDPKRG